MSAIKLCLFCSFAWRLGPGQVYETSIGRRTTDRPGGGLLPAPDPPPLLPPSAIRTANFSAENFAERCVDDRRRRSLLFSKSFQKICPEGKFFEMVSWGGLGGRSPPQESPLPVPCPSGGAEPPSGICVTRALPPGGLGGRSPPRNFRYLCLAPCMDGEKSKNEPQASCRPKNLTI